MKLKFSLLYAAIAVLPLGPVFGQSLQDADGPQARESVRQVAIIGAGAAGSSAAYHLHNYSSRYGVSVNITLFEKTGRIGGRTLTVNPFDDPSQRVELGASIFIEKNLILYGALKDFDLKKRDPDEDSDPTLGIWDGDSFVFTINESHSFWWNAAKVIWRYGVMAPRRTQNLMESTIAKFLRLYEEPFFPFRSLTQRTYELGLVDATGVTGEQLLKANSVGDLYAHDIVQASTRVNYASNIARIHGLDTMVSMAPEGAMAVAGGNWQIFEKMVHKSGAGLLLNTSVVSIGLASHDKDTQDRVRYTLEVAPSSNSSSSAEKYPLVFDDVVIATPYQFSKIAAGDGVIQHSIDAIPYVQLHVTIFSTPFRFSPAFFGLTDTTAIPGTVLTTLNKDDDPTSGVEGVGKAGFFSISTLRKVQNPKTKKEEYLYKIFSPAAVTPGFLSRLFGVDVPSTFTIATENTDSTESPISWYHPHVFNSYPKALPRVTFQDPIIGPSLYYTSGMESFISTMETNALMGKNVARLILDDILGIYSGVGAGSEDGSVLVADGMQKIVCDRGKTPPAQDMLKDL
ncbi:Prenylcysteine lyase-domain-containing protein [Lasiosphaeria miniovina]|uniref:Prenylcysteine lyase-domain-containing protein n=1 Tax=Lasiosphaeria miniovina TaxID=1954250 RepID=A0AA40AC95_9PEZI|nr:Prenylcysteine lyase-domain-containing protein [Lasiosphaeria miniovina]KAK0713201.1 Prenylcysteine lyase-domain-containing protein [Lasiosphaeria miniovina]